MTHFAEGSALLSTNVPDSLVDAMRKRPKPAW
jgi:hypothetical protein